MRVGWSADVTCWLKLLLTYIVMQCIYSIDLVTVVPNHRVCDTAASRFAAHMRQRIDALPVVLGHPALGPLGNIFDDICQCR
jgi:hypothetical protein